MNPPRIAVSRAARRTLFVVFCLGVIAEAALLSEADPRQDTTGRFEVGLFTGCGMLLWCLTFGKAERELTSIGWLIVFVAFLLAVFLPAID
jgi:hypothetical protein